MAENTGVLICGECANGNLASITTELLGIGKKLASDLGEKLYCVLLSDKVGGAAQEAIAYGAEKVYVIEDPLLKVYLTDPYVSAMTKLCKEIKPNILLMGQTTIGRDLGPRLAFRLETGLTTDCIELRIDLGTKLMLQTKPVYGGNALSIIVCEKSRPQMATVRAKTQASLERDSSRKGEVIAFNPGLDASKVKEKFIDRQLVQAEGIKLEDASVVVCGGRGMGGPENFSQIYALAKLLGGAVGASRPPCDSGWVPVTIQVGLTGKMISPTLYIAVAISGASQHISGCSGSKNIIAINKDPEANIFKVAQYGVVGDFKKILPPFTQKVKELLAG